MSKVWINHDLVWNIIAFNNWLTSNFENWWAGYNQAFYNISRGKVMHCRLETEILQGQIIKKKVCESFKSKTLKVLQ